MYEETGVIVHDDGDVESTQSNWGVIAHDQKRVV
jgi:hypothetical protein